jgi:hypothetical protein
VDVPHITKVDTEVISEVLKLALVFIGTRYWFLIVIVNLGTM